MNDYSKYEIKLEKMQVKENLKDYTFTSSKTVAEFLRKELEMEKFDREHFIEVSVDVKGNITGWHVVTIGGIASAELHPREVFKFGILNNASGVFLAHNHPSGDPTPSEDDIRTTKRLIAAGKLLGIPVIDHIVIGDESYISFQDKELTEF